MIGKFLATKSYNPANQANQRKLFEARAEHEATLQRERARAAQLKAERDAAELTGKSGDLDFMYKVPASLSAPPPPPPTTASTANLDKEKPVTMRELLAAHGIANAPLAGSYVADMPASSVVVKPFGKTLSAARCIKCGALGHSMGDRDCPLFAADVDDSQRHLIRPDDPLASTWKFRVKPVDSGAFGGEVKDGEQHLHEPVDIPAEDSPDAAFLQQLSLKQKKRLLAKAHKLERKEKKKQHRKRSKRHHKKRRRRDSSSSSSSSSSSASSSSRSKS